jgi:hypothetical protein
VNDFRTLVGLDPDATGGDVYLRGLAAAPVPDEDIANVPAVQKSWLPPTAENKANSDQVQADYGVRLGDVAEQAAKGSLSKAQFMSQFKKLLQQAAAAQIKAAGKPFDAEAIAVFVKEQMGYAEAWYDSGLADSDPDSARSRAMLYANATRSMYWKAVSPVPLDYYPGDGQTLCKSNCKCVLEFDMTTKPGYCLVTWNPGDIQEQCEDCYRLGTVWDPLEVKL